MKPWWVVGAERPASARPRREGVAEREEGERLDLGEADVGDALEGADRVFGQELPDRVELHGEF